MGKKKNLARQLHCKTEGKTWFLSSWDFAGPAGGKIVFQGGLSQGRGSLSPDILENTVRDFQVAEQIAFSICIFLP